MRAVQQAIGGARCECPPPHGSPRVQLSKQKWPLPPSCPQGGKGIYVLTSVV